MNDQPAFEDLELLFLPEWLKEPQPASPSAQSEDTADAQDTGDQPGGQPRQPGRRHKRDRDTRPRHKRPAPSGADTPARQPASPRQERPPAPVNARFFFKPEPQFVNSVLPKIKQALAAFPLYKLASMFLAEPARYRVVIERKNPSGPGFLTTRDRAFVVTADTPREQVETIAFQTLADKFYSKEEVIGPEIRGNFRSVAVCRLNGEVIAPSNHHSYLPALKRMYDERFSRRMSFQKFKESVTHVTDENLLNQWKEQARRKTIWRPLPQPAPSAAPLSDSDDPASEEPSAETALSPDQPAPPPQAPSSAEAADPNAPSSPAPEPSASPEQPPAPPAEIDSPESASPESQPDGSPAQPSPSSGPVFESEAAVRRDFILNHLPSLLITRNRIVLSGARAPSALRGPLLHACRRALESEQRFPATLARSLCRTATARDLHAFKLNGKILCVSAVRPAAVDPDSPLLAEGVARILRAVRSQPGIHRTQLAAQLLGQPPAAGSPLQPQPETDPEAARAAFLKDLRFAVSAGFLIELNDGTLHFAPPPAESAPAAAGAQAEAAAGHGQDESNPPEEGASADDEPQADQPGGASAPVDGPPENPEDQPSPAPEPPARALPESSPSDPAPADSSGGLITAPASEQRSGASIATAPAPSTEEPGTPAAPDPALPAAAHQPADANPDAGSPDSPAHLP